MGLDLPDGLERSGGADTAESATTWRAAAVVARGGDGAGSHPVAAVGGAAGFRSPEAAKRGGSCALAVDADPLAAAGHASVAAEGQRARLRLDCRGVVQGVGFRPAVHRLASRLGLGGSLHNGPEGVQLDLVGRRADLECFLASLADALPPAAHLESLDPCWLVSEAEVAAGFSPPAKPFVSPAPPALAPDLAAAPRLTISAESAAPLNAPSGAAADPVAAAGTPRLTISAEPAATAVPLGIGLVARSLVADRAPCPNCRRELDDPRSRRGGDPFLSCCDCGPRYAIATAEPWRRAHSTLAAFVPCPACAAEFADPADRRFHSETISCPACGPRLSLVVAADSAGPGLGAAWPEPEPEPEPEPMALSLSSSTAAAAAAAAAAVAVAGAGAGAGGPAESAATRSTRLIVAAAELLAAGRILALQGVGGFQLLVDATNRAAVARLRQRKRRPARPFALLVAEPAWLEPHVQLEAAALDLLHSPAAPIVLLPRRLSAVAAPAGSASLQGSVTARTGEGRQAGQADDHPPGSHRAVTHPSDSDHADHPWPESEQANVVHPPDTGPLHAQLADPHCADPQLRDSHSTDPNVSDPHFAGLPHTDRWPDPFPGVAPGSAQLGVMLPASPLHLLLVRRFGRPLVCTSGNRSGEPLCTDPAEALERLAGIADAFLIHDRPIARPLDDSVVQLIDGQPALLRRARGYAPEPLVLTRSHLDAAPAAVLALGGDLKAAPALALGSRVWLSPHLGDLTEWRSFERFRTGIAELRDRYGDQLEWIAVDRHPLYLSHQVGVAMVVPPLVLQKVQHHAAHALAVVAEQGLEPPLLAFCADGLGYGEDFVAVGRSSDGVHTGSFHAPDQLSAGFPARGLPLGGRSSQPNGPAALPGSAGTADGASPPASSLSPPLWGGELLAIGPDRIERLACLRPLPLPGGDRAAREPRRVALGLLAAVDPGLLEHPGAIRCRRAFRAAERDLLLAMVERGVNCPGSSSLGRLFDGVASLLGLCQRTSFEGEAGLRLQGLATLAAAGPLIDSGLSGRQGFRQPQAGSAPCWDGERRAGSCSDPCAPDPGNRPDAALPPQRSYPFPQVPAAAGDGSTLPLGWLDWQPLLEALLADRAAGEAPSRCALRFHQAVAVGVADLLASAARRRGCRTVVLAGGCFQNALLLEDLTAQLRRRGLEPHSARAVPGNDGGLALGQLWACRRPPLSPPTRDPTPPPEAPPDTGG